jgi:hypothetical protein
MKASFALLLNAGGIIESWVKENNVHKLILKSQSHKLILKSQSCTVVDVVQKFH